MTKNGKLPGWKVSVIRRFRRKKMPVAEIAKRTELALSEVRGVLHSAPQPKRNKKRKLKIQAANAALVKVHVHPTGVDGMLAKLSTQIMRVCPDAQRLVIDFPSGEALLYVMQTTRIAFGKQIS